MISPKQMQLALADVEPLPEDLADLVPYASRIGDAAAIYVAKAGKRASDLSSSVSVESITRTISLAQEIIKYASAIHRLLLAPSSALGDIDESYTAMSDTDMRDTAIDAPVIEQ